MPSNNDDANVANVNVDDDQLFYSYLMPGLRFQPSDEELIVHHLMRKLSNQPLTLNRIRQVMLYNFDPPQLCEIYDRAADREWYFFTPRSKKYPNGSRPSRSTPTGFWKATGCDIEIKRNGKIIGFKKSLCFYQGKFSNGKKTNWLMHEYRIHKTSDNTQKDMKLDEWVLCKVFNKELNALKPQHRRNHQLRQRVLPPPPLPLPLQETISEQENQGGHLVPQALEQGSMEMNNNNMQIIAHNNGSINVGMNNNNTMKMMQNLYHQRLTPENCGLKYLVNDRQFQDVTVNIPIPSYELNQYDIAEMDAYFLNQSQNPQSNPSDYKLNLDDEEEQFLNSLLLDKPKYFP